MKYFEIPFAESGDRTAIPDPAQVSGSVSYTLGFPIKYSTATGSGGLNVPRDSVNELYYEVTLALKAWQENTFPDYFAAIGASGPGYDQYAAVMYSGVAYLSLVSANTAVPGTDPTKWFVIGAWLPLAGGTLTGALGIGGAPAANILLDLQSTTKAFAPPRMTTAQKNSISSPTGGMQVFDTDLQQLDYYNATLSSWLAVGNPIGAPFSNLQAAWASNTTLTISAAECIVYNSSNLTRIRRTVSGTINCATTGANGLDVGSLTSNTWYYGYIIYNPTTDTTALLASASASSPTLPSGYTFSTKVCTAFRTSASSTIIGFKQVGARYQYVVGSNLSAGRSMASGSAGSPSTPTWVSISVSSFVPTSVSGVISIFAKQLTNTTMVAPNNSYGAATSSTNPPPLVVASSDGSITADMVLESSNIYWASDGGYVYCTGFVLNL